MEEFNRDDLIELIYKDNNKILYKIFKEKDKKQAIKILQTLTANIRLDYHGVADLINDTDKIIESNQYNICIISYMGTHSENRIKTRLELIKRIENFQINFGIINFVRCEDKKAKNIFHEPGSKAWINSLIKTGDKAIFIDDSLDHYNSVKSLNIKNLQSYLFKGNKNELVKLINEMVT